MIDAYHLYQAVLDKVNKPENGYIDFELFTRKTNNISLGYFRELVRKLQSESVSDKDKQAIADQLSPYLESVVIASDNGIVARPDDYEFFAALRARFDGGERAVELGNLYSLLCEGGDDPTINMMEVQDKIKAMLNTDHYVPVDLLDAQQIAKRTSSHIKRKRPSQRKPIAEQKGKSFELYPKDLASVLLVYYRTPGEGKLVMSIDPETEMPYYDAFNSRAWEWTKGSQDALVVLISQDVGVFTRERDLIQMTEFQKKE